jgi:hypothetical protein
MTARALRIAVIRNHAAHKGKLFLAIFADKFE